MLIGNKCDLEDFRKVSKASGEAEANKLNIPFMEVSAKNSINIEEAFRTLVMLILKSNFSNDISSKTKPKKTVSEEGEPIPVRLVNEPPPPINSKCNC